VNTLSETLTAIDARFKSVAPERYARWLVLPSILVILILGPAMYLWGVDGPFRVLRYPQATLIWAVSLPLAFFSYEGLVAVWRCRLGLAAKLALSLCHLSAIALSLVPMVVEIVVIGAVGGVNRDR